MDNAPELAQSVEPNLGNKDLSTALNQFAILRSSLVDTPPALLDRLPQRGVKPPIVDSIPSVTGEPKIVLGAEFRGSGTTVEKRIFHCTVNGTRCVIWAPKNSYEPGHEVKYEILYGRGKEVPWMLRYLRDVAVMDCLDERLKPQLPVRVEILQPTHIVAVADKQVTNLLGPESDLIQQGKFSGQDFATLLPSCKENLSLVVPLMDMGTTVDHFFADESPLTAAEKLQLLRTLLGFNIELADAGVIFADQAKEKDNYLFGADAQGQPVVYVMDFDLQPMDPDKVQARLADKTVLRRALIGPSQEEIVAEQKKKFFDSFREQYEQSTREDVIWERKDRGLSEASPEEFERLVDSRLHQDFETYNDDLEGSLTKYAAESEPVNRSLVIRSPDKIAILKNPHFISQFFPYSASALQPLVDYLQEQVKTSILDPQDPIKAWRKASEVVTDLFRFACYLETQGVDTSTRLGEITRVYLDHLKKSQDFP